MKNPHTRKKEPELVRQALLDSAARIAARYGFAALTLQSVAQAANVTKGGLFHHFENKQALIEGMFHDQIKTFEASVNARIATDDVSYGRFTRAYVKSIFDRKEFGTGSTWDAMASSVTADRAMREMWASWVARQLEEHSRTDASLALETVRLAADGAWLNYLIDGPIPEKIDDLEKHLVSLTYGPL